MMSGSIDPDGAAMKAVFGILQRQATTLAFGDAFAMLAIGCAGLRLPHPSVPSGETGHGDASRLQTRTEMPRVAGQIDERKSEAILEAAMALFAEKGGAASMEQIARRAGVSKQTLYNRYASKVEIGRAMAERRSEAITAPLRSGGANRSRS